MVREGDFGGGRGGEGGAGGTGGGGNDGGGEGGDPGLGGINGGIGGMGSKLHEANPALMACPAYSRPLSRVPDGMPEITPGVAWHLSASVMVSAVTSGKRPRSWATAPVTCGHAIDVPLIVHLALSLPAQAPMIEDPGAQISTHGPQLEKVERESLLVVEPTVRASTALAGELKHASALSLPAATTTTTFAAWARATASFSIDERGPPRDIEITDGRPDCVAWAVAQSMPAITPAKDPLPSQLSTCTGMIVASFATPSVAPAAVDATCVPCDEHPELASSMTPSGTQGQPLP